MTQFAANYVIPSMNASLRVDPSRLWGLKKRFMGEMTMRLQRVRMDVQASIVDNDCFGIQTDSILLPFKSLTVAPVRAFDFPRTADKVEAFMEWLWKQEELYMLSGGKKGFALIITPGAGGIEKAWTDIYIESAYQQGIRRGRSELRKAGFNVPAIQQEPFGSGVAAAMSQPIHADRVGLIYSRTFEELKSVLAVTNTAIRRQIADGLSSGLAKGIADGKNPRVIARELYKDTANHLDKIGKVRLRAIARTEVMRAHTEAITAEFANIDLDMDVVILAEWETGFKPCPICVDLADGGPYKLEEIRQLMPAHPNCGCVPLPYIESKRERVEAAPPSTGPGKSKKDAKPSKYVPKKTMKEAEQWAKDHMVNAMHKAGRPLTLDELNKVNAEIAKMPDALLKKMTDGGFRLDAVANGGVTIHPDLKYLKGTQPRGWAPGSTMDEVQGCALPRIAVVLANIENLDSNLVLHEAGHIADNVISSISKLSETTEWNKIWSRCVASKVIKNPYYLQSGGVGQSEWFAECFGAYFGGYPITGETRALPGYVKKYFDILARDVTEGYY